ncbi:class I SAM-dependent methyltransferase [Halioxenophilus sp. WMMB6]|uniref:class I SAM-dependent methyltransferase n=1 Tax=Halioxenophilus sp. WMMB6 TaxID=3073815 RepID=UPI00295ECF3B|nr:50S ribosomal protein L11 methyltransferase [Halioxenophilus sp. WMMB6]
MSLSPLERLTEKLREKIPNGELALTRLPQCDAIQLWLLDANYPQWQLSHEQAAELMDNPPFWSFCWASGQVLAKQILANPEWVAGRSLLDFGAGSGVVAIAAKLAGAREVWVCDQDANALLAAEANAALNGVSLQLCNELSTAPSTDLVTVADVFYDRDNLPLLATMQKKFGEILMADCRLKGEPLPGLTIVDFQRSHTVPDLSELDEFNNVYIYRSTGVSTQAVDSSTP